MTLAVEIGRTKFPDRQGGTHHPTVYWNPAEAISPHAIIVGSSGTGKTHRLRDLIKKLIGITRNVDIHILDVHGDIAPAARNRVRFSETTDYGLNLLEVTTDPDFGGVRRRVNSFINMINRTQQKLGTRQSAVLRNLLYDLYEKNGYDHRDPRTWNPRTNPRVRGRSAETRRHPNISDLAAMCAYIQKMVMLGGDGQTVRLLSSHEKILRKFYREHERGESVDDAAVEASKIKLIDSFTGWARACETGDEFQKWIRYGSPDTLAAVSERIQALDDTGIFKDQPPEFTAADPLKVYDIQALSEDEQKMFAEVLLERLFLEAKARGQKSAPDTFIVIDEAHKFMTQDNDHILNRMAREVRKFGVGLILVSQNFDHFPEDLIANAATTMVLGLHPMHHEKAARKLGVERKRLNFIKPKRTALVQIRTGVGTGLANSFTDVELFA